MAWLCQSRSLHILSFILRTIHQNFSCISLHYTYIIPCLVPKNHQKRTKKARSAKLESSVSGTKKTAAETRPKPRPTYNGATTHPGPDERVASAALMLLGHDMTHPVHGKREVVTNVGGFNHNDDDSEVMDEKEQKDEIEG
jgi:hypothetical protein